MKLRKRILLVFIALTGLAIATYAVELWQHNRALAPPSADTLDAAFEAGTAWLESNRDTALMRRNPIIWWMIGQAAAQSREPGLRDVFAEYRARYVDDQPVSYWTVLFEPAALTPLPDLNERDLPYYNYHLLHALTCDRKLGAAPLVQAQYEPDFCTGTRRRMAACVTHQLVGIRFALDTGCGEADALRELQSTLQARVVRQLRFDPRVVDANVQRLLLLADGGAGDHIEPVWVRKFLEAQNADGGWDDFDPLVPLPGGYALGYSSKLFSVRRSRSGLHTTAQALWLLAILRNADTEQTRVEPH